VSSAQLGLEQRRVSLGRIADEVFDIVVVGGGVTGCGSALDAATRGLSVERHGIKRVVGISALGRGTGMADNLRFGVTDRVMGGRALEALGDPTRRAIFERLVGRPRSVRELADVVPVSRPAVSQHLRMLK
jgi:glycine/D-amino acid oxidase-like deaminating enzyme